MESGNLCIRQLYAILQHKHAIVPVHALRTSYCQLRQTPNLDISLMATMTFKSQSMEALFEDEAVVLSTDNQALEDS